MHGARRQFGAQRLVVDDVLEEARVALLVDLAREVLEEAVELVDVAVGDGQEGGRVRLLGTRDRAHVDLQLVAEALHPARDPDEVTALEAPRQDVRVLERAGLDRARPVAQLERQIGRARARGQPVLARTGEDRVDLIAGAQAGDGELGGGHGVHSG